MMRPALAALLLALPLLPALTSPARAETTAWAENEGGRMRIVALPPQADGVAKAVLQIEPKPGWVTYWREPGESGIPPQVTVTGGAGLGTLSYPVPKVLELGPLRDIGYDAPVSLPFVLKDVSGSAQAQVFIGICNQICIPFQTHFELKLGTGRPEAGEAAMVAEAEASLPSPAEESLKAESAALKDSMLMLSVRAPQGAAVEAIVTGPPGYVFTAKGTADGEGRAELNVALTGLAPDKAAAAEGWSVLLKAGGRAVEAAISPH